MYTSFVEEFKVIELDEYAFIVNVYSSLTLFVVWNESLEM
jgi:hypothetical protein